MGSGYSRVWITVNTDVHIAHGICVLDALQAGLDNRPAILRGGGEMDQVHAEIVYGQQLMSLAVIFVAILAFVGVCLAVWGMYLTRGTRESVERVSQVLDRVDQRLERMSFYLFSKLGPAETK
jgi:hypothetical protein